MDKTLNSESIRYYKRVFNECKTYEETAETIVPDTMPDVLEILHVEGVALTRSMESESGRATLSGSVRACAIYCPDGGDGAESIDINIPFTAAVDDAGITPNTKITGKIRLCGLDAHLLNPRKIMVRANVAVTLTGYEAVEMRACATGDEDGELELEVLRKTEQANLIVDVSEKSFVISDEFEPGCGSGEVLCSQVALEIGEVKAVGAKLIFKGQAKLCVLYSPDSSGVPERLEFSTAFSQIMEMEGAPEKGESKLNLLLAAAYVESSRAAVGGALAMELHLVAQAVTSAEFEIDLVCDTYSTEYEVENGYESFEAGVGSHEISGRVVVGTFVDSVVELEKVIGFSVHLAEPVVTEGGGEMLISGAGTVSALCMAVDERMHGIRGSFEYEYKVETREGEKYTLSLEAGSDVYATTAGSGVEFKIPVEFSIQAAAARMLAGVGSVKKLDKKDKSGCPSAVLHFAAEGEELWNVAKNHNSTCELIMAVNELESEKIEPGCVLLIPGVR